MPPRSEHAPSASGPADAPTAYRLTGTKIWISNAPEADRYLVFATLDPEAGAKGITAFLVEKGTPGFRFGAHERKMGIRACPAAELVFDGAEVPAGNRLGAEGEGYKIALSALGEGRISIAAACVGIARAGLEASARYLGQRKAFGAPLAEQQGLRFMLAEMAREVAAARAVTQRGGAGQGPRRIDRRGLVDRQVDRLRCRDAGRHRRRPAVRGERLLARDRAWSA